MADTALTIKQIEYALYDSSLFDKNRCISVPNISYGLLSYEADFVSMSKSGYLTEVEIKRSFSDFKADFKKRHMHNDILITYFYYCIPIKILDKVKAFLEEKFTTRTARPALITYDETGYIEKVPNFGSPVAFKNMYARKLFMEEQVKFSRLGCFRYWSMQEKTVGVELKHIQDEAYRKRYSKEPNYVQLEIEFPE
jgi:hypothetical protein